MASKQDVTSGDESDDGSHDVLPPVDDGGEGGLVVRGDEWRWADIPLATVRRRTARRCDRG